MMPPRQVAPSSHAYSTSPFQYQQQQSSGPSTYQHQAQQPTNGIGLGLSTPPTHNLLASPIPNITGSSTGNVLTRAPATPAPLSAPLAANSVAALGSLYPPGASILRLMQLSDAVVGKGISDETNFKKLPYWRRLVQEFFVADGYLRQVLWNPQAREQRAFQLPVAALARYLHTAHNSNVESRSMALLHAKEYSHHALHSIPSPPESKRAVFGVPDARTTHFVQVNCAKMSIEYENGWMVVHTGIVRAGLTPDPMMAGVAGPSLGPAGLKLQFLDLYFTDQESFISGARISRTVSEHVIPDDVVAKIRGSSGDFFKRAVKKEKRDREEKERGFVPNNKGDDEAGSQDQEGKFGIAVEKTTLPESPVNEHGITLRAMRCLEITESVCQLRDLMNYAAQHDLGPLNALHRLAEDFRAAQNGRSGTTFNDNGAGGHGSGHGSSDENNHPRSGPSPLSASGSGGGVETLITSPSSSGGIGGGSGGAVGEYEAMNAAGGGGGEGMLKRRSARMDGGLGAEDVGGGGDIPSPAKRVR